MGFNLALFRLWGPAILLGSTAFAAQAQTLTAEQILSEFNAVIIDNFNTTSDVEGRLVAGNIQSGATFYNNPSPRAAPPPSRRSTRSPSAVAPPATSTTGATSITSTATAAATTSMAAAR